MVTCLKQGTVILSAYEISREISQPVAIKEPRDYHLRANFLAEDMGLEEVRIVQTLKIQGGKAPSTFVPGIVPKPV